MLKAIYCSEVNINQVHLTYDDLTLRCWTSALDPAKILTRWRKNDVLLVYINTFCYMYKTVRKTFQKIALSIVLIIIVLSIQAGSDNAFVCWTDISALEVLRNRAINRHLLTYVRSANPTYHAFELLLCVGRGGRWAEHATVLWNVTITPSWRSFCTNESYFTCTMETFGICGFEMAFEILRRKCQEHTFTSFCVE